MAHCNGAVVVTESPTIPTYSAESGSSTTPAQESASVEIHVSEDAQDPCECGELEAVAGVLVQEDLPPREFEAEFETETHTLGGEGTTDLRPDSVAMNRLTAFSIGPIAIGDASQGARSRVWYARVDNDLGKVFVARQSDAGTDWDAEIELFSFIGVVDEMDMAFEQAGRPVVALQIAGNIHLYWFNPLVSLFQLTNFDSGRTPAVLLDNPADTANSDVLLFYIRDASAKVVYRQQRDRYNVRYDTPYLTDSNDFIQKLIRTTDNRVAGLIVVRNTVTGRYSLDRVETTLYPFILEVEPLDLFASLLSGTLAIIIINHTLFDKEEAESTGRLQSGTLVVVVLLHTLFDKEEAESTGRLQSGTLVSIIIEHVLFDKEESESTGRLQSGTLVAVVFDHILFDKEQTESTGRLISGTLVNA